MAAVSMQIPASASLIELVIPLSTCPVTEIKRFRGGSLEITKSWLGDISSPGPCLILCSSICLLGSVWLSICLLSLSLSLSPPFLNIHLYSVLSQSSIFSDRREENRKGMLCLHLTDSVIPESATERESATHLNRWHRLVLRMSEQLHKICMACHKVAQPGKIGLCGIRVAFCCCLRDRNANHAECLVSCPYNTL